MAAAAVALAGLLGACASPTNKLSRLSMGGPSHLEAYLPAYWSWEPTMAPGPRMTLLRLFARNPETTQMRIIPRPDLRVPVAVNAAQARELALRDLAVSKDCEGLGTAIQERRLSHGFAYYCAQPLQASAATATGASSLLPTSAGVLVFQGLVMRFAILGVTSEENSAAWSIIQGMQVSTVVPSP